MSCINKKKFQTWEKQQFQENLWNSDYISTLNFLKFFFQEKTFARGLKRHKISTALSSHLLGGLREPSAKIRVFSVFLPHVPVVAKLSLISVAVSCREVFPTICSSFITLLSICTRFCVKGFPTTPY